MNAFAVPNELWLEIFRHLSTETIQSLALTRRAFVPLCRTLLFTELIVHPYHNVFAMGQAIAYDPDTLAQQTARLEFWCSSAIAPLVRSCRIDPGRVLFMGQSAIRDYDVRTADPYVLMDLLLARLTDGRFTSLRYLSAIGTQYALRHLHAFLKLPPLEKLEILGCRSRDSGEAAEENTHSLQPLQVSRCSLRQYPTGKNELYQWLRLLSPLALQDLDMRSSSWDEVVELPNLRRLATHCGPQSINKMLAFAGRFPSVKRFVVRVVGLESGDSLPSPTLPAELAASLLPVIESFNGPCELAHLFLSRETLTALTLTWSPWDKLVGIQSAHVTYFDAAVDALDASQMSQLFLSLPNLVGMRLRLWDLPETILSPSLNLNIKLFFDALPTIATLPRSLERLFICWEPGYGNFDYHRTPHIPDFDRLKSGLCERCPALWALWIDGYEYLLKWNKQDGHQELGNSFAHVSSIRTGLDAFWSAG